MTNMAHVEFRPRRSTKAEWAYENPVLAEGEFVVEVPDTGVGTGAISAKMGDGVSTYEQLPYAFQSTGGGANKTLVVGERIHEETSFINP